MIGFALILAIVMFILAIAFDMIEWDLAGKFCSTLCLIGFVVFIFGVFYHGLIAVFGG